MNILWVDLLRFIPEAKSLIRWMFHRIHYHFHFHWIWFATLQQKLFEYEIKKHDNRSQLVWVRVERTLRRKLKNKLLHQSLYLVWVFFLARNSTPANRTIIRIFWFHETQKLIFQHVYIFFATISIVRTFIYFDLPIYWIKITVKPFMKCIFRTKANFFHFTNTYTSIYGIIYKFLTWNNSKTTLTSPSLNLFDLYYSFQQQ